MELYLQPPPYMPPWRAQGQRYRYHITVLKKTLSEAQHSIALRKSPSKTGEQSIAAGQSAALGPGQ